MSGRKVRFSAEAEAICVEALQSVSSKLDGVHILYATRFVRPEGKVKGTSTSALARAAFDASLKQMSRALASGIPNDGWLVVTANGLEIYGRRTITNAIAGHKGSIPNAVIKCVRVKHGKTPTKSEIVLVLADDSEAQLLVKTAETYPALALWAAGVASAAPPPAQKPFDTDRLYRESTISGH